MADISFFSDEVDFLLKNQGLVNSWLKELVKNEHGNLSEVNVVFVSDDKLLEMNKRFLNHDYYTDIITFPKKGVGISVELYISIDRVGENATAENTDFNEEVHRVIAHGLLHLLGYNDKSDKEKKEMRARELFYLNLRSF